MAMLNNQRVPLSWFDAFWVVKSRSQQRLTLSDIDPMETEPDPSETGIQFVEPTLALNSRGLYTTEDYHHLSSTLWLFNIAMENHHFW